MNKDKNPLLAAIIFTYNHEKTIAKCIESHINQNTTYPYEIRIYDDCSTDGTTEICKEYAEKYPNKIKLIVQKENTFLLPYEKTQSYKSIQELDTKYFCIIDGDDHWSDENKVQIALDILENNPEYVGFAHDTLHVNTYTNESKSYVNELRGWKVENPVQLGATPFFFFSSRVFRNCGFADKKICPIDFLLYFYHFSKGPIYYYDKIMAHYYLSEYCTFSSINRSEQSLLLSGFAYKLSKLFDFEQDDLCMDVQKYYNSFYSLVDSHYNGLLRYKKLFGIRWGWHLWYFFTFVPRYGFECLNINWIYQRKKVRDRADNRFREFKIFKDKQKKDFEKNLKKEEKLVFIIQQILSKGILSNTKLMKRIENSFKRKSERIEKYKQEMAYIENEITDIEKKMISIKNESIKQKEDKKSK